jgi:hypothetical protein
MAYWQRLIRTITKPVHLAHALRTGQLKRGDKILLCLAGPGQARRVTFLWPRAPLILEAGVRVPVGGWGIVASINGANHERFMWGDIVSVRLYRYDRRRRKIA